MGLYRRKWKDKNGKHHTSKVWWMSYHPRGFEPTKLTTRIISGRILTSCQATSPEKFQQS
jgi:hypothetical protein